MDRRTSFFAPLRARLRSLPALAASAPSSLAHAPMRGLRGGGYQSGFRSGAGALSLVAGVILLASAVLKAHALAEEPIAVLSFSRAFTALAAQIEIGLGAWLLSGMYFKTACRCATAVFALFASVSLIKAVSGAESCGCFGNFSVNPWFSFALDATLACGLWVLRPQAASAEAFRSSRALFVLAVFSSPLAVSVALAAIAPSGTPLGFGEESVGGGYTRLKPGNWIGEQLPLLPYIDAADHLKTGSWLLVVHRQSCGPCRAAVDEVKKTIRERPAGNDGAARIALIEMPPYGPTRPVPKSLAVGRLSASHDWYAPLPLLIWIRDGKVLSCMSSPSKDALANELTLSSNPGRRNDAGPASSATALHTASRESGIHSSQSAGGSLEDPGPLVALRPKLTAREVEPFLFVRSEDLDFGEVWEDQRFIWRLPIENRTRQQIRIVRFLSSCACLSVEPPSLRLPPGEAATLELQFNLSAGPTEPFELPVRDFAAEVAAVTAGKPARIARWVVQGRVRNAISMTPDALDFGEASVGGGAFEPRVVQITPRTPLRTLILESGSPVVSAKLSTDPAERSFNLEIVPAESLASGNFKTELIVRPVTVNGERLPPKRLPVRFRFVDDVQAVPPQLFLGACTVGSTVQDTITVRSASGQSFEIEGIENPSALCIRQTGRLDHTKQYRITQQAERTGSRSSVFTFLVRTADGKRLRIPVRATYLGIEQ